MSYSVAAVMLTPSIVQEAFVDVCVQEKIESLYYVCLCVVYTSHEDFCNYIQFARKLIINRR